MAFPVPVYPTLATLEVGAFYSYLMPSRSERALMRSIARVKRLILRADAAPAPLPPASSVLVERRAVDVAHWLPNMPRGHERAERSRRPRYQFAGGVSG